MTCLRPYHSDPAPSTSAPCFKFPATGRGREYWLDNYGIAVADYVRYIVMEATTILTIAEMPGYLRSLHGVLTGQENDDLISHLA